MVTDAARRLVFLPEQNIVVVVSVGPTVRLYHMDTPGEPCAVFNRHTGSVNNVAQLDEDVVASVGTDNRLFTWRAATAELVDEWKHGYNLCSVAKLGYSKVIVGDTLGNFDSYDPQVGVFL